MQDAAELLTFLTLPASAERALETLAGPVRSWFRQRLGEPTLPQRFAWPTIAAGQSLLLSAPTGTGKTLAAFLPVVSQLLPGSLAPTVRCLYVAPLKALVNDAGRNMRRHLAELGARLPDGPPSISVGVRTGDTSVRRRRQLVEEPPEILLTTPESLALMLLNRNARAVLMGLRWVVVDEVHALAESKRGCDLALSLERLEDLVGEPLQRIGLSATCAPLTTAARFLVGVNRPCTVAAVRDEQPWQVRIEPLPAASLPVRGFLTPVVQHLQTEMETNRTTLVFANTRGLAERLAWAVRRQLPSLAEMVGVHHSSVAASRRRHTEYRLKHGHLRLVISSSTLELGIDIGSVDGVVLVHPPGGVVRLLQRLGRAGHAPGRPRRGLVITTGPAELLEAAVTIASGVTHELESLRVPEKPLDVLCQHLLGLAGQGWCEAQRAFNLLRQAWPYHDLHWDEFSQCLDYLSGRGSDGSDWLPARLRWEDGSFTLRERRLLRLVRRNLGTILGEEPATVRLPDETCLGQVDQDFAERLQPGDRFLLEGRCLEFLRLDRTGMRVQEVVGRPATPRWLSSGWPLSAELARRLFLLRTRVAEALLHGRNQARDLLQRDYNLPPAAAEEIVTLLSEQETISEMPDLLRVLVETVGHPGDVTCYVHTPLNQPANEALAQVFCRRLLRAGARTVGAVSADLGLAVAVQGGPNLGADDWRLLLSPRDFASDLNEAINAGQLLRERFRQVATISLMLLQQPRGGQRRVGGHDWVERRLFEKVRSTQPDFILLQQARREVERFLDASAALAFVQEMPRREVRCRTLREAGPLARCWTQMLPGEEQTTEGPAAALERLRRALLGEAEPISSPVPSRNPSPQPPPRSGEGEKARNPSPQPPPRSGEGEQKF